MGYDECIPEFLIGFLNFEMGLLEKFLIYTSQPRIGALRCMGGVWFHPTSTNQPPVLWRQPFPPAVQDALISEANPGGSLSISDLELAAMIGHKDILCAYADVVERTLWLATKNCAALAWSTNRSSTSVGPRSYLLRYNALHQRTHRYVAVHDHIAEPANVILADNASCLWHLCDSALLTHFNTCYPQALPWQLRTLTPATNSALIGSLFRKLPSSAYAISAATPLPRPGVCGPYSVTTSASMCSACHQTPSPFCKCLPSASAPAPSVPAVAACAFAQWSTQCAVRRRCTPAWGHRTLA
jgi:hypothetical protein